MSDSLKHHGIKGMKWGVRRYQNKDGSLTNAGKARYSRDVRENYAKKRENRITIKEPDPKRWVREDTARRKKSVDNTTNLVRSTKKLNETVTRASDKRKKSNDIDLSHMTDQELRNAINRAQLEDQYKRLYAQSGSKGRDYVNTVLDVAEDVLVVGGSALGLALAIKELRG